jgi:hypothetical protein
MALITTTGKTVTLDETVGLQNLAVTPTALEDANDNDIANTALPLAFSTRLSSLLPPGVGPIGSALSGYTGTNLGEDIVSISAASGGTGFDLGFVDSGGAPLNGLDSGLDTLAGDNILLYTDTTNNNIVLGRTGAADGPIVFALFLEETGGTASAPTGAKMWSAQYAPLKNPDASNPDDPLVLTTDLFVGASQNLEFSLANAPSGQNLFLMFTTANPATIVDSSGVTRITGPSIIATGKDPANQSTGVNITTGDTINTSQAGGPTTFGTNNQMIVEQEGIRFSFVTGARQNVTIPNLDQNEADVEANIDFTNTFSARTAAFDVVQLQSGKSAVVQVHAFNTAAESGATFIDGYVGDSTVAVTNVKVTKNGTVLIDIDTSPTPTTANGVTVAFAGGIAKISGVTAGANIEYTTTDDHNRVLVSNEGTGKGQTSADFDIGGFKLLQVSAATAEIGSKVRFEDDGPSISTTGTEPTLTVDETDITTNDTKSFAANFTSAFGADGAGTLAYALGVSASGADSGLVDTASGNHVFLFVESGVVVGREGASAGTAASGAVVFTVSVADNGDVKLDQQRSVIHPNATDPDDAKTLSAANLVTLTGTITDKDGDSQNAVLNIGQNLVFEDDGPAVTSKTDIVYSNSGNPSPGGTGVFIYDIGEDSRLTFSSSNSDFSAITLGGVVGSIPISNPVVEWASETSTSAVFNLQFSYQADPASSTTTLATGTLTFDKVNGTYTVALAQPIQGFTVLTTGTALGFTGYTVNTDTIDQTQPDVSVAQLSTDFFVQFSGISEPGSGTGTSNLQALPAAPGTSYVNGDLFTQAATWVSVSNTANGVAGDTLQKGEVLDMDFFNSNPKGHTNLVPTTQASGIFLKFDGIGSEDLVAFVKLVDPDDGSRTTKAIIIDNSDILKFGSTIPSGYNIVLDNNDGAVIIENNDFNTGSQNYLIEGVQLLVSTEGVTGTAINLNPATGTGGASTTTQAFGPATTDNDVIKVSDIGFVTANSGTLNSNLSFELALVDADGDSTAPQTLDVGIVSGTTFTGGADSEAFNVDLSASLNAYRIESFSVSGDLINLLGDPTATYSINNSGADSIVTVNESGGQVTTVTVVGVDLDSSDIFLI